MEQVIELVNDTWDTLGDLVDAHLGSKTHPGTCEACQKFKRIDNNLAALMELIETGKLS